MSNVSNRHNVNKFVAGKSAALTGQRLAKVGYKLTEKMKDAGILSVPDSVCVSVPVLSVDNLTPEQMKNLAPHLRGFLEGVQDKVIRGMIEESKHTLTSIPDEAISVDACISWLEQEETGGRLTIERITGWFTENLSGKLAEFLRGFASKSITDPEKLALAVKQTSKGYQDMLAALSGGKTSYNATQREKLIKVLALTEEGDDIAEKMVKRLDAMEKKEREEMLSVGMIAFE
jgi:hypothetical protein